jgi:hypothetical protein
MFDPLDDDSALSLQTLYRDAIYGAIHAEKRDPIVPDWQGARCGRSATAKWHRDRGSASSCGVRCWVAGCWDVYHATLDPNWDGLSGTCPFVGASLVRVSAQIPEPSSMLLFSVGMMGLVRGSGGAVGSGLTLPNAPTHRLNVAVRRGRRFCFRIELECPKWVKTPHNHLSRSASALLPLTDIAAGTTGFRGKADALSNVR